jgi:hypothetical protein
MEYSPPTSPRIEALQIAYHTRKEILEGKQDAVALLRSCLVVATNVNKENAKAWITQELSGYSESDSLPPYRVILCPYQTNGEHAGFLDAEIPYNVHILMSYIQLHRNLTLKRQNRFIEVNDSRLVTVLAGVIDRCLHFLNDIISELQYGGIVDNLMEAIRKETDEKLANLDTLLRNEVQSLHINLASTNPADWNKAAHSCRKMLKLTADQLFPPQDQAYTMKDKRIIEVKDPQFINRLCAFVDQQTSSDNRRILIAEIQYLESYLRQVVKYDQRGEHQPSIEKFHANMMAIHTYLILSELLRIAK